MKSLTFELHLMMCNLRVLVSSSRESRVFYRWLELYSGIAQYMGEVLSI